MKLQLEILTDRVLLSASPAALPSLAETTAYMSAVQNEESQLIATVQQEVNSLRTMVTQAIAQETAYVEQQIDQRLGIRGSGSGSGTSSTTNNSQNQTLKTSKQSAGRGSGSGAAATAPGSASTQGGHKLPPTNNGSGSGSGSGHMPSVYFSSGSYNVTETGSGAGSHGSGSCPSPYAILQVDDSSSIQSVSVDYSTSDGTATAGEDYTAESGTVIIPAGQGYQYIHIPILDDGTDESGGPESFYVTLSNPGGAVLGTPSVAQVNIAEAFQQQPTDTLVWNPMCGSTDASDPTNWYDEQIGNNLTKGQPGPGSSTPVILDGTFSNYSNSAIDWTNSVTIASMTIQNGYNAQQTIDDGNTVELDGMDGFSLYMSDSSGSAPATGSANAAPPAAGGASELNLKFGNNATEKADSDQTITNMTLSGFPNGQYIIAGGTTKIAISSGGAAAYRDRIGVQFTINNGAKLLDYGFNALTFTNSDLAINIYGNMNVAFGETGIANTLIDGNGYQNDYINVSGGTLLYAGAKGITDTFTVPVYVQGGGTFRVTSSVQAQNTGGQLIVQNLTGYTFPNGQKNSVYMEGDSSVQLAYGDTLECDQDYYQAAGTLETTDTTTCTLQDGPNGTPGTATIAGGSLKINQPNTGGYGQLNVNAQTLQFTGQLVVAIQVYDPSKNQQPQQDLLHVSGTTNILAGSTLTVYVNDAPPANGSKWIIIADDGGNVTGDFVKPITTSPQTNLNAGVDKGNAKQYVLSF